MAQFLNDILDQPAAIQRSFDQYRDSFHEHLSRLAKWRQNSLSPVVFVGMGSSLYAPLAVTPMLNRSGVTTYIQEAGELYHYGLKGVPENALVIAVSQSGESIETRKVVKVLSERFKIISITNDIESTIAKHADLVLPLFAGEEAAASTKTFVTSVFVLYLASTALLNKPLPDVNNVGTLVFRLGGILHHLSDYIGEYLEFLGGLDNVHVIGRGPSLASVYHGALIMKETADSNAEGMAGGTFRHGPLELAGPGHKAIVMAHSGATCQLNIGLAQELAKYGSKVLLLTDQSVEHHKNLSVVNMPEIQEDLASILYITPLEFLAWDAARRMGWTPGIPRLISKVTTQE